jgi:hypothetical protein
MKKHAVRLLALSCVSGLVASDHGDVAREATPRTNSALTATSEGQLAWDCVPNYWWGYWTWAWQPCAWLDRAYVEGTIGAVAQVTPPVEARPWARERGSDAATPEQATR